MKSTSKTMLNIPSVEQYISMLYISAHLPEIQIVYFMPSESTETVTVEISPVDHWQLMPAGYVYGNLTTLDKLTMGMIWIVNDEAPGYYFLSSKISFGGSIVVNSNGLISYFIGGASINISQVAYSIILFLQN